MEIHSKNYRRIPKAYSTLLATSDIFYSNNNILDVNCVYTITTIMWRCTSACPFRDKWRDGVLYKKYINTTPTVLYAQGTFKLEKSLCISYAKLLHYKILVMGNTK